MNAPKRSGNVPDLEGKKFGKLLVLHYVGSRNWRSFWMCRCDCGTQIEKNGGLLIRGEATHCGCGSACIRHGMYNTPEYRTWAMMKQRCHNEKNAGFPEYGGRGIEVTPEWRDSFEKFYADMGPRPDPSFSIERKDVNGNYEPDNCKWASPKEQGNNRRNNVKFEYKGRTIGYPEAMEISGHSRGMLESRMKRGMSITEAIETPKVPRGKGVRKPK